MLVALHAAREQVEEGAEEVQVLPRHVGHLEDGADPGRRRGRGRERGRRRGRGELCQSIINLHCICLCIHVHL